MLLLNYQNLPHDKKIGWKRYPYESGMKFQKELTLPAAFGQPPLYVRHIESSYLDEKVLIIAQVEKPITEEIREQIKLESREFIERTNVFKHQYGDDLNCDNCSYEYPDFDEENNVCRCPNCGHIYAVDDYDPDYEEEQLDLGACCNCGKLDNSSINMLMLTKKAHIPGTGWGCVICNLPSDGAMCLLCDDCLKLKQNRQLDHPKQIIYGYATHKQRIEFKPDELEDFNHRDIPHGDLASDNN